MSLAPKLDSDCEVLRSMIRYTEERVGKAGLEAVISDQYTECLGMAETNNSKPQHDW